MGFGESEDLNVALYVRHSAGLRPHTDPVIPPLDREPPPVDPPADRELIEVQWAGWWRDLLRVLPSRKEPPHELPPLIEDSPELAAYPQLQVLVRERMPHPEWLNGRKFEEMDLMLKGPKPPLFETKLVAAWEREHSRRARPFSLHFTLLPVQTAQSWRIGPDQVLITRGLIADLPAYEQLVRSLIDEFA
jgi:hypothetical protein